MIRLAAIALLALAMAAALAACAAPAPVIGQLEIAMVPEPATPIAGEPATLAIAVSRGGEPVQGARVLVVRRMIGVVHPDDDIVFESVERGGGGYMATTTFAAPGRWDVQLIVTPSAGEARTAAFTVEVTGP
jgi:hypothetical protein